MQKNNINHFLQTVEKRSDIIKNPAVFTSQDFKSTFDRFSILQRKWLNYNFQECFKGIISIIFCQIVTLRNVETLQP